jgi:hypothetical protein
MERPNRPPDFTIALDGELVCRTFLFWWGETVITASYYSDAFECDLDRWTIKMTNMWHMFPYFKQHEKEKVVDAYYTWLIEKELSR